MWNLQVGSCIFLLEASYQLSFIFLCEATGVLFVSRDAYRVLREEKELEKKEDRKTKAINILFFI